MSLIQIAIAAVIIITLLRVFKDVLKGGVVIAIILIAASLLGGSYFMGLH